MNLTTWMKTTLSDARSSSAATQVEVQEPRVWRHPIPAKRQNMRMYDRWILKLLAVFVVAACAVIQGQSAPRQRIDPALATLGGGFVSDSAQVNGTSLHYVRGGTGSAVILVHGFPEDWYEYHRVMPLLAKQFTVVAVDLRGIGGSAETAGGYDAANMAEDVHQLAEHLHLEHVYVVGHDIGGMVALCLRPPLSGN
jgi:hypothetical protein